MDDPPGGRARAPTASHQSPIPTAADCRYIASILPSSLSFDPHKSEQYRDLIFDHGGKENHLFKLPAVVRHRSCEVRLRGRTSAQEEFTQVEMAYYFWNTFKMAIQTIVNECIIGTGKKGGMEILTKELDGLGLPKTLTDSVAIVMVYPTGSQQIPREGMNIYNV